MRRAEGSCTECRRRAGLPLVTTAPNCTPIMKKTSDLIARYRAYQQRIAAAPCPARPKRLSRPALPPEQRPWRGSRTKHNHQHVLARLKELESIGSTARELGISRSTVASIAHKAGISLKKNVPACRGPEILDALNAGFRTAEIVRKLGVSRSLVSIWKRRLNHQSPSTPYQQSA
jgi:transposase